MIKNITDQEKRAMSMPFRMPFLYGLQRAIRIITKMKRREVPQRYRGLLNTDKTNKLAALKKTYNPAKYLQSLGLSLKQP